MQMHALTQLVVRESLMGGFKQQGLASMLSSLFQKFVRFDSDDADTFVVGRNYAAHVKVAPRPAKRSALVGPCSSPRRDILLGSSGLVSWKVIHQFCGVTRALPDNNCGASRASSLRAFKCDPHDS